ncbi:hypothetical protein PCCS19_05630 [Paenibacillus sp. CCS19]|uniref:hypothetical protein n=1 Tax=Paenibacillus sp. CCS19 TaxID=3158387 RepID=UPI002565A37A|nr:hypothetical protein [Paenibacillus cellulosilyticus]GMK37509.1 hypothetical protein PCCS19_05630 [Paenibacillus cellulosilyticus]
MFAQTWTFDYDASDSEKKIADRFILSDAQAKCLYQLLGMQIVMHNGLQQHELIELVAINLEQNLPIIARFDSYYNPWDQLFGKEHNDHSCLITGMDLQARTFTICDPYFGKQNEWVPIEVIKQAADGRYGSVILLPIADNPAPLELLYTSAERFLQENGMLQFVTDMERDWTDDLSFIWSKVSEGLTFWHTNFYRVIKTHIILNRHKFKQFVQYYIDHEGHHLVLQSMTDQLDLIITHWEAALNTLTKAAITSMISPRLKDHFIAKVKDIVQLEYNLAHMIVSKSLDTSSQSQEKETETAAKAGELTGHWQHVQLDLSEHLNNQGFSYELSAACEADITGTGEYVYVNSGQLESSTFNISTIDSDRMDNISCMGQVIPIEPTRCKGVAILGCSEWGDSSAFLTVIHQDGTEKRYPFILSDIVTQPNYNESIEMKLSLVNKNKGLNVSDAYLFRVTVSFEGDEVVDSIQLPICTNMHIIAMNMLV